MQDLGGGARQEETPARVRAEQAARRARELREQATDLDRQATEARAEATADLTRAAQLEQEGDRKSFLATFYGGKATSGAERAAEVRERANRILEQTEELQREADRLREEADERAHAAQLAASESAAQARQLDEEAEDAEFRAGVLRDRAQARARQAEQARTEAGQRAENAASLQERAEQGSAEAAQLNEQAATLEAQAARLRREARQLRVQELRGDEAKASGALLGPMGLGFGLANLAAPSFMAMGGQTGSSSASAVADAASEAVKMIRGGSWSKGNAGKLIGGAFAGAGLVVAAAGASAKDPTARTIGMVLQSGGLVIKSLGEVQDADYAKGVGAIIAALGPALQAGAFWSEPELAKLLTGDAIAEGTTGSRLLTAAPFFAVGTGAGDAVQEMIKAARTGRYNPAKLAAGVVLGAGNAFFGGGTAGRLVWMRGLGLGLQVPGFVVKAIGEGVKLENTRYGRWNRAREEPSAA